MGDGGWEDDQEGTGFILGMLVTAINIVDGPCSEL